LGRGCPHVMSIGYYFYGHVEKYCQLSWFFWGDACHHGSITKLSIRKHNTCDKVSI
jgi:hypothetical protein